jgi:hypothetical protein
MIGSEAPGRMALFVRGRLIKISGKKKQPINKKKNKL